MERPSTGHIVRGILLLTAIMTAIGVALGILLPNHIMPRQMSADSHAAVMTVIVFSVAAAPVAALVYAVGLYSLLRWRHKGAEQPTVDGAPIRGNNAVTTTWLIVSTVLVIFVLGWGLTFLSSAATSHADPLEVNVIGQQWAWSFQYPGTGVESSKLVLPVNREVHFHVSSKDVTHGFWPQELGIQIDANTLQSSSISTTPDKLGSFSVRCSQLCGLYHAYMQTKGEVVSQKNFAAWLQANGASASSASRVAVVAQGRAHS